MMNQTTREQTFFKPTKRKIILPLILLLLPLTLFLISVPYVGYFFVLLLATLCIPLNPLLERLHLVIGAPGWFDMMGGPSLGGIIVVMVLYAAIAYFIICLLTYVTRKNPESPLSTNISSSSRSLINRHPKITILLVFSILIITGAIILTLRQTSQVAPTEEAVTQETPKITETEQPNSEKMECKKTNGEWCEFTNEKYNYSFKFPADCVVSSQIQTGKGGINIIKDDFVIISQEETKRQERDFGIHITISHTDTLFFNPPEETDLITWLNLKAHDMYYPNYPIPNKPNLTIDGLPAVYIDMDSAQSGHQADVYVLNKNKLFKINTMDTGSREAKDFFTAFLATFKFN
ncbi:MAG: hypothetical protein PHW01_02400 [Patescibacteria group bacterium]|nr:hypothetical protein [Patescibacteria group bacterium]